MEHLLNVQGISKRFGATQALKDISFNVEKGSTHAIIGENGAGKSTLIKIISGIITPEEGQLIFEGVRFSPKTIMEARLAGITTAFQELSLLPNLTISENLALPSLRNGKGLIHKKENEDRAEHILRKYHLRHLSPRDYVGRLSLAEKQKLEIARAFSHRPKLLLLDEPTAALPDPEWLFDIINGEAGKELTILYISHRLHEVRRLCKKGTVLRNGQSIQTFIMDEVSDQDIIQMMVGERKDYLLEIKAPKAWQFTKPGIELKQLTGKRIKDITLKLYEGEILGVAGLEGQGQSELFRIIYGLEAAKNGSILIEGRKYNFKTPQDALKRGIGFIPEERKTEGIFPGLSTLHNVTLSSLSKISRLGFLNDRVEYCESLIQAEHVQLAERYLGRDITALSGGNQQKAIMARVIMSDAKYLLLFDPTRGVDLGTKQAFFEIMREFTNNGGSILWYSTDLSELVNHSDRCLVFYNGHVVHDTKGLETSELDLLAYATGGHSKGGTKG